MRSIARPVYRLLSGPVGSVQQVDTDSSDFVLTYDDGPDPRYTPDLLDVLADHQATATFFVLMSKVNAAPNLLREVAAAGHEIGLHGIDHQRLTNFSNRDVLQRTRAGKEQLEDVLGDSVAWIRPPYGAQTFGTYRAVRKAGLSPVMWGPTMWDWKDVPHQIRVQKAVSGATQGAILLGHDSFPGPADGVDAKA